MDLRHVTKCHSPASSGSRRGHLPHYQVLLVGGRGLFGRPAVGRGGWCWAAGRHRRNVFLRMQPLRGSEGEDLQRKGVGGISPFETAKVGCAERRGE